MLETLSRGDTVRVVVREGTSAPFVAGRDGQYIHLLDNSLTPGRTVTVEITSINNSRRIAQADIVSESRDADRDLVDWSQPELDFEEVRHQLRRIDPWKFESFVAELWVQMGWDANPTSGSGDGDVDVIATNTNPVPQTHCIEVKRYGPDNPVGVGDIREYGYVINQRPDCDMALIVTTSRFTQQAKTESERHCVRLIDCDRLVELVNEYDPNRALLNRYVVEHT